MMLIQRICIAFRGLGICRIVEVAIRVRAAMLLKKVTLNSKRNPNCNLHSQYRHQIDNS